MDSPFPEVRGIVIRRIDFLQRRYVFQPGANIIIGSICASAILGNQRFGTEFIQKPDDLSASVRFMKGGNAGDALARTSEERYNWFQSVGHTNRNAIT
jgi:hypothetical protein